jgi:hypothetical protein
MRTGKRRQWPNLRRDPDRFLRGTEKIREKPQPQQSVFQLRLNPGTSGIEARNFNVSAKFMSVTPCRLVDIY